MVRLIRFRTERFDPSSEPPNPINPIPGAALLEWLCSRLASRGFPSDGVAAEDWGWYAIVYDAAARHLVGASGEPVEGTTFEWVIQIHRQRTLWQRLRGSDALDAESRLLRAIEELLGAEPDFREVSCEWES